MTQGELTPAIGAHLAAVAVLATQACVGLRVLDLLGLGQSLRRVERLAFGWVAGFAVGTAALLALVGAGALTATTVLLLGGGALAASWPVPRDACLGVARLLREATPRSHVLLVVAAGVALCVWAQPFWVESLLPNSDWDSALYQLPLAERYRDGVLWGRDPYFPAFSFPGAVNLTYAALLALDLERAITPLNFWVQALGLAATCGLGARLGGRGAAAWAGVVYVATPILWQLAIDPRIDGFLALCCLLAFYALALWLLEGEDSHLHLLALCLGGALGCKYTAVPFAVGLCAVALVLRLRATPRSGPIRAPRLLLYLVLLTVPNGSWYVANTVLHGDPLVPMLRGNYYLDLRGEAVHLPPDSEDEPAVADDPAFDRMLASFADIPASAPPAHLFDVLDLLRNPDRYAVRPHHGIGPLVFLSLLLPLLLPREKRARRAAVVSWCAAWAGYALLGAEANLVRYLAPILPVLAATSGLAISRIPLRPLQAVVGLCAAALLVSDFQTERGKLAVLLPNGESPTRLFEPSARTQWLKQVGYNFTPPMAWVTEQIDRFVASGRMAATDTILMVGEGKGRFLPCRYLPDASWFAHRFVAELRNAGLDHDVLARRLRDQGITHVLYNRGYYDDWVLTSTTTSRSRVAFALSHVERFLESHGRTLFRGAGMQLAEIRPRDPGSGVE